MLVKLRGADRGTLISCPPLPEGGASSLRTVDLSTPLLESVGGTEGEEGEGVGGGWGCVCGVRFWRPANHDEKPLQN